MSEINLSKDARRWWDTIKKGLEKSKKGRFGPKNHRKWPRVTLGTLLSKSGISVI